MNIDTDNWIWVIKINILIIRGPKLSIHVLDFQISILSIMFNCQYKYASSVKLTHHWYRREQYFIHTLLMKDYNNFLDRRSCWLGRGGFIICYAPDITHANFRKNRDIFLKIGMGNVKGITKNVPQLISISTHPCHT